MGDGYKPQGYWYTDDEGNTLDYVQEPLFVVNQQQQKLHWTSTQVPKLMNMTVLEMGFLNR